MKTITATKLRKELFGCLEQLKHGENIVIEWNGKPVGQLVPMRKVANWREQVSIKPRLLVKEHEAFAPLDEVWAEYT